MSRNKSQGTALERSIVVRARKAGYQSDRLPEGGMRDLGDVWIGNHPLQGGDVYPVLWWKRLIPVGGSRRRPLGAVEVVVMDPETFLAIIDEVQGWASFVVEAKAAQSLSVTKVFDKARSKVA